ARAKFDSLNDFATPVENPSAHLQRGDRSIPLIWIPNFPAPRADRLTISPRVASIPPDICWRNACQESCEFAPQGACCRSTAACRDVFSALSDPLPGSVSLICPLQFKPVTCVASIQGTISTGTPIERPSSRSARP